MAARQEACFLPGGRRPRLPSSGSAGSIPEQRFGVGFCTAHDVDDLEAAIGPVAQLVRAHA